MIEQGYSRGVASRAAVGAGIANMTLEMVGVKLLAKGAGITAKALRESLSKEVAAGVTEALTRPTLGAAVRTAAKGFAQGLSGEVVTEVGQEAVNITAEEIAQLLYGLADPMRAQRYPLAGPLLHRLRRVVTPV